MPSLSTSYLSKMAVASCIFFRASAFWTALFFNSFEEHMKLSMFLVHSLTLCKSFAIVCLVSAGGCPGTSWTLISEPFFTMKSVQTRSLSFASRPASSTAFDVATASSSSRSFPLERGSASSLSTLEACSASPISSSSSLSSCSARSKASLRFFSASTLCSSALRCCSFIISIRCRACSSPTSASCFILSFCVAQLSSSFWRISSSSFFSSSILSDVAERTFWMTLRMLSIARCSSRFWVISCSRCTLSTSCFFLISSCCFFMSSTRFLCSSIRFLLASSSFFRFSSSCRLVASACCCLIFWSCSDWDD
mmetsp:Transcript_83989/g.246322  ORF Transcript_83989/g.246322 Transcript_83989/m.246322 type:complete len:309 (+) Transcript_83989:2066-2992(+)